MVCKLLSHGGEILIPDRLLVSGWTKNRNPTAYAVETRPVNSRARPTRTVDTRTESVPILVEN